MADFYEDMRAVAADLLAPTSQGGLGQGQIELSRTTVETDEDKPWLPPTETTVTEPLDGAVRGVSSSLVGVEVGGTVILASDRQCIATVPQMGYTAGDRLSVDGAEVNIIAVEPIPAAGITSAVKFIIR